MIEAGAKEVVEADIFEGIKFAGQEIAKLVPFIENIIKEVGLPKKEAAKDEEKEEIKNIISKKVHQFLDSQDLSSCFNPDKSKMKLAIEKIKTELNEMLKEDSDVSKDMRSFGLSILDESLEKSFKVLVLEKSNRQDNRSLDEIRS